MPGHPAHECRPASLRCHVFGADAAALQRTAHDDALPVFAAVAVGVDDDGVELGAVLVKTGETEAGSSAGESGVEQADTAERGFFEVREETLDEGVARGEEVDALVPDGFLAVEGAEEGRAGGDSWQGLHAGAGAQFDRVARLAALGLDVEFELLARCQHDVRGQFLEVGRDAGENSVGEFGAVRVAVEFVVRGGLDAALPLARLGDDFVEALVRG